MRKADEFLDDLLAYVAPHGGQALVIMEVMPKFSTDPNWVTSAGSLEGDTLARYVERVADLITTEPRIDWANVPDAPRGRHKHVTKYRSMMMSE